MPSGQEAPDWYAARDQIDSCGVDAEYTHGYPNMEARECLRAAYDNGTPMELSRVTYGDEGEVLRAHFRVLGSGSYEIVGESAASRQDLVRGELEGWVRYQCERFVFLDEPGYEVDRAPMVNADGECEQVAYLPA